MALVSHGAAMVRPLVAGRVRPAGRASTGDPAAWSSVALSPDGGTLAVQTASGGIEMVDVARMRIPATCSTARRP